MNSVDQPQKIESGLYTGAADVGRIWATISAVLASIISIAMIVGGIYIIYHRSHLSIVKGRVTKSSYDCVTHKNQNGTTRTCKVDISYSVDGKKINKTFTSSTI